MRVIYFLLALIVIIGSVFLATYASDHLPDSYGPAILFSACWGVVGGTILASLSIAPSEG